VNLDVEDSGQDLLAGKSKYYQDTYADSNCGVKRLSALALRDVLDDVEKYGILPTGSTIAKRAKIDSI